MQGERGKKGEKGRGKGRGRERETDKQTESQRDRESERERQRGLCLVLFPFDICYILPENNLKAPLTGFLLVGWRC